MKRRKKKQKNKIDIRKYISDIKKRIEPKKWFASFVSTGKKTITDFSKGIFSKEVIISVMTVLIVLVIVLLNVLESSKSHREGQGDVERYEERARHPLTGQIIEQELDTLPRVFSIMVENAADAWPLVGLDEAFLVIEAPVEGNIPRFISFYSEEDTTRKIGPVRSARPYYLDWATEFDALYAHVGGSPEALDLIAHSDIRDVNQFFNGDTFYRQNGNRFAPHNVYTFIDRLLDAWDAKEFSEPDYDMWKFADGEVVGNTSIHLDWMDGVTYDVEWNFDESENVYERYQGRSPMKMEDGEGIFSDNVIVIATDIRTIDNEGRKELRTIGEGDMLLAQNGEVILGTWKKESADSRLNFYNHEGEEVVMNAGKTWIEVVGSLSQTEIIK